MFGFRLNIMMILGMFPFMLSSVPYQNLNQVTNWRHVKNDRVGRSPRRQFIGTGDDKITLSGVLYPEVSGGDLSLSALRTMAYSGMPWPLIEGTGCIYGMFVIVNITETRTEFFQDGKARKIEFTITLEKASEDLREKLADFSLSDILPF